jgi:arylsulfatase A
MTMKKLTTLLFSLLCALCSQSGAADKPNIVFILADDLGIDGLSCYGSDKHKTPNIDSLATSGTRFETCYAAPLCGPSRCLLMTGRYAFRTGGLGNGSWRGEGTGAKSANEVSIAKLLKQHGYVTGESGKWRQVGETPHDWGFDEYLTDPTAGGWFWETKYLKNGTQITLPEGTYAPDVIQDFSIDFIKRHKDQPFFLYYAMHLVHAPILRTPDSAKDAAKRDGGFYDDNIRYMDKQVGGIISELEKLGLRQKTLVIFSGDNGTTRAASSTIGGRSISGNKSTLLEGGSRVPLIVNWPGVTPAGKVLKDIISFADPYATLAEIGGAKLPDGVKIDGRSFAAQIRGEPGRPREWAYVQLDNRWFVREPGFKMNEKGELFDMSDAPYVEKPVAADADNAMSKAARQRLTAVLAELNPAGGKKDSETADGGKKAARKKRKNKQ